MAKAQKQVSENVREHYKELVHYASECIKCGACETRCSFGAKIKEKMDEAVQISWY